MLGAGIPGVVSTILSDPRAWEQFWVYLGLGLAGVVILAMTWIARIGRGRLLDRNGTVYLLQEQARGWQDDDVRKWLGSAERQFARVIKVPGPGRLAGPWDWPLDDGAQHWEGRTTELARSFRALHLDDAADTPNGIFMWAWWAVAVAFAARLTAADRGLALDVWQRPSRGRAGELIPAPWSQRPHRFCQDRQSPTLPSLPAGCAQRELTWPALLTSTPQAGRQVVGDAGVPGEVTVLLARLGYQSWEPVPDVPAEPSGPEPLTLVLRDAAGLIRGDTVRTDLHELRILPPPGRTQFPWSAFPSLVDEVSSWVRGKAEKAEGRTLLLGAVMPPEVALGLGVAAGQLDRPGWPAHLWPIVYQPGSGDLVIPRLDLGTVSLARHGT